MKNTIYKLLMLTGLFVLTGSLTGCKDDNTQGVKVNDKPMVISKVWLEDAQATVTDRDITHDFARLGQMLRLEGSGLLGVQKIFINGFATNFNPALQTDTNLWVQLSNDTPTTDAPADVINTIMLQKGDMQYVFPFDIRSAAPSVTSVSHTMPQAGEQITLYGTGLQGITSITFPGNIVVTDGIVSDDTDGKFCTVTVPAGISADGGSLLVQGANGGAYSAACFNYTKGLLQNFDGIDNFSWGSGIDDTAQTAVIPSASDNLPKSQGGYSEFNASGSDAGGTIEKFWLNSSAIIAKMQANLSASMPADSCGIQMDIYVEGAWNSGLIRFVMADGYDAVNAKYSMVYQPVYTEDATTGAAVAYNAAGFVNPGCWYTITLPFGKSADFKGLTLTDVLTPMSGASYMQAGPFFENSGIPAPEGGTDPVFEPPRRGSVVTRLCPPPDQ